MNVIDSDIECQKTKDKASEKVENKTSDGDSSRADSLLLDVSSADFDPIVAIYSSDLSLPVPDAPVLDNVEAFVSKMTNVAKSSRPKQSVREEKLERQFLPEQMPIQTKRKALPNLFRYMEKQSEQASVGPMSILARCVQSGERIRVHIRGFNRMRGFAVGTLVAFDKHWNLALVDVDETFTRKRFPKTSLFDVNDVTESLDRLNVKKSGAKNLANEKKAQKIVQREQVGCSVGHVVKSRRKTEVVERHVPQAVLRGEHIAIVQIL